MSVAWRNVKITPPSARQPDPSRQAVCFRRETSCRQNGLKSPAQSRHADSGHNYSHDFSAIAINAKIPAAIQTKLAASAAGDEHERDADAVADLVMKKTGRNTSTPCLKCKKRKHSAQAKSVDTQTSPNIDANVESGIRSFPGKGQPLPTSERRFFESRFGCDFANVRIHTCPKANAAARALKAQAFTYGSDIIFGSNRFAPTTGYGRHLLAHELAHTVQQGAARPAGHCDSNRSHTHPHRKEHIDRSPDEFTEAQLQDYLGYLTRIDDTEGNLDSDNKAREIVNNWRLGGSPYVLNIQRKRLMIREMQQGFTGDEDEQAILEILERSYNFELSAIFGSGGIDVASLNSDFHGTEWRRLQNFYTRRFEGGMAAMLRGTITPRGYPVPLGLDIEQAAGSVVDISDPTAFIMELRGARPSWHVPGVLGILCSRDSPVVSRLRTLTVKRIQSIDVTGWTFSSSSWTSRTLHPNGLANQSSGLIGILTQRPNGTDIDCDDAAEILVHEVRHQNQPAGWIRYHRELDAYTYDEQWAISRGIPPSSSGTSHRMTTPGGQQVPNPTVIEQHVRRFYGGPNPAAPGVTVVGHQPPATSILENPDGTSAGTRPSQQGDTYIDNNTLSLNGEQTIQPHEWDCPS